MIEIDIPKGMTTAWPLYTFGNTVTVSYVFHDNTKPIRNLLCSQINQYNAEIFPALVAPSPLSPVTEDRHFFTPRASLESTSSDEEKSDCAAARKIWGQFYCRIQFEVEM